jgi:HAE1 family hydrophobic/amphiphilic exporter-1
MLLSDVSVRRPVAMSCLIIGLTLLGMNSYRKMGLELLPKMDVPYVTVVTIYPGASPMDIEVDVAKKIEDAVSSIDGLKHVSSLCMENVVQTIIEFNIGVDVNVAATDVREKIDKIISDFPSDVEKPVIMKFDINAMPIATLALTGDLSVEDLYDYADNTLRDKLSVLSGVANVEIIGGSAREVHVLLDRKALSAAGLTSLHVVQALEGGVASIPSGRVRERGDEYSVRYDADYESVKDIGALQIAGKDGARRYIQDLGQVVMSADERRQEAFVDGRPCIGIRVVKKADANAVEVVRNVQATLGRLRANLPGGMELVWITDEGAFIQVSVDSTKTSIIAGILLTAAILFFFLFNVRTTFIVAITMPLTIVISLFFMQMLGFTLNTSTLLAMGLSVGVLVTNSIVVLESIMGHFQKTKDAWKSAREGTGEVAIAVFASAGTNVVVLFPIGMMGSVVGQFFRPFAWTTLTVNVVSLFISFTLTPILCALLLKESSRNWSIFNKMEKWVNYILEKTIGRYTAVLRWISDRRWACAVALSVSAAIFIHALSLTPKIGFSFVPSLDRGEVFIKLEYPTRQDLAETVSRVKEVEKKVRDLPSLRHIFTSVGKMDAILGQSSEGVYLGQILLKFEDKTKRNFGVQQMLDEIRKRLESYPDCIVTASISSVIGGQNVPIEMEIGGDSLDELGRIAGKIQEMARQMPGIVGPDTTVREGKPELRVLPRRAILADMGASPGNMGLMMRANLEGIKAATYKSGARTYDIRVKLVEEPGKSQISEFVVPVGADKSVIMSGLADIRERRVPVQITRTDKQRVVKFLADLAADMPMGTMVKQMSARLDSGSMLPAGYTYYFRGQYEKMGEAMAAFLEAGILAIMLTYLTLAAILESFKRPFLILMTIPLGLIGVLWALYMRGISINIFVLLGCVMLVGIVVNNAVLVLTHMQANREKGMEPHPAMLNALAGEFRVVIMVTLAAVLGMLPLAIATGLGSELSIGIGVASVGGIAISAVLTLMVIPLMYMIVTWRSKRLP